MNDAGHEDFASKGRKMPIMDKPNESGTMPFTSFMASYTLSFVARPK